MDGTDRRSGVLSDTSGGNCPINSSESVIVSNGFALLFALGVSSPELDEDDESCAAGDGVLGRRSVKPEG